MRFMNIQFAFRIESLVIMAACKALFAGSANSFISYCLTHYQLYQILIHLIDGSRITLPLIIFLSVNLLTRRLFRPQAL